ncbi:SDR family NAD(P)-dependent oxidoreductase [Streptomyces iconiensis]|uniref:SDR family oxidoreductase n=1 Tax=Streptomyces iconiensis TaxID=1384038 RepID=A0ABT6ZNY3_9ACTN|nr:SDR family oxidoreductase [Streptomyces iconiensis]MDJ1130761.1 SDR family oxidoreductase [Streptomyces iconiensis]
MTGGAQGIGRATADRLIDEGAQVMIMDTDEESGRSTVAELEERAGGKRIGFVRGDISDESQVVAAVRATEQSFGGVELLVNCAAVFVMRGVEATVEEWRRVMDVNVMGHALMVKHTAPLMEAAGGGSVVNISSISAHIAQPGFLTYSATKAAIVGMTRCMATDLAAKGIRVNAVSPGTVWNANLARRYREKYGLSRAGADAHPDIGGRHMLHRTADPQEIASTIAFLLSSEASFVTGENLMVDAGHSVM